MRKKSWQKLNFFLVCALIFTLFAPWKTANASSGDPIQMASLLGMPAMDPIVKDDGSVVVGSRTIVNGVYHQDFMSVSSSGALTKQWTADGESYSAKDKDGNQWIYNYDYSTGILSYYSLDGSIKWQKTINAYNIDEVDQLGNLYFMSAADDTYSKVTPEGSIISNINYPNRVNDNGTIYSIQDDGNYSGFGTHEKLVAYDPSGKELWEDNFDKPELNATNSEVYVQDCNSHGLVLAEVDYFDLNNNIIESDLYAVNALGTILWSQNVDYETSDWYAYGLVGDKLYVDNNSSISIYDAASKTLLNNLNTSTSSDYSYVMDDNNDNTLYLKTGDGNGEKIAAYDIGGKELWAVPMDTSTHSLWDWKVDNNRLYLDMSDNNSQSYEILTYNLGDGSLLKTYQGKNSQYNASFVTYSNGFVAQDVVSPSWDGLNSTTNIVKVSFGEDPTPPSDGGNGTKPTLPTQSFPDVNDSYFAADAISYITALGYINGYLDGTFAPTKPITRAEAAKVIFKDLGLTETSSTFSDVSGSYWANGNIGAVAKAGIITGYGNGKFAPAQNLTRAETAAIICRAHNLSANSTASFGDVSTGYWAADYINALASEGIINGYPGGNFAPEANITRAEFAVVLARALNPSFRP